MVTIENPDGLLLIDPQQKQVLRKFDVQGKSQLPECIARFPNL